MPEPDRNCLRRWGLRLALVGLLFGATGCNYIRLKRASFERTFRSAGLSQRQAVLGEDTLSFWDGGSGSPILLVHGYGPNAVWHWNEQVTLLGRNHRLIVPDLLWSGSSTSVRKDYGIHHQTAALLALLDRLGVERVDVVGLSYGGFVAWMLAAYHPERVNRLVMIGSPGATYTSADMKALCERERVENAADLFAPRTVAGVRRVLALGFQDPPWIPDFAARQAVEELYEKRRTEARAVMDAALAELERAASIPTPTAPTLLIWGEKDLVFPLSLSDRVLRRLEGRAKRVVVGATRHAPNLERPERVNVLLRDFLAPPD
ncbi:MAG: alpha/beta hydrolase [Deltaproteobacteria bacterium]|nr:alpha/beta hydrolase [Deltaproteobacteria bacterium]